MTDLLAWRIEADFEGTLHTVCPRGHLDRVVEQDEAIRWNGLNLTSESTAVASVTSGPDWDHDGWLCTECIGSPYDHRLAPPDGFEITDWTS